MRAILLEDTKSECQWRLENGRLITTKVDGHWNMTFWENEQQIEVDNEINFIDEREEWGPISFFDLFPLFLLEKD